MKTCANTTAQTPVQSLSLIERIGRATQSPHRQSGTAHRLIEVLRSWFTANREDFEVWTTQQPGGPILWSAIDHRTGVAIQLISEEDMRQWIETQIRSSAKPTEERSPYVRW